VPVAHPSSLFAKWAWAAVAGFHVFDAGKNRHKVFVVFCDEPSLLAQFALKFLLISLDSWLGSRY
jgi:hypothetical protein